MMIDIVKESFKRANNNQSKLTPEVFEVGGFSGAKFRHLLNNLGERCKCYLEVGCLHGSTLTAACYQNEKMVAYGVENFSEFDAALPVLQGNINRFTPHVHLLTMDAFEPATTTLIPKGKVDLFFYDGHHSEDAHEKALRAFDANLAKEVIYLVDDWNWAHVKVAALRGLKSCPFKVVYSQEIATQDGDGAGYWNGLGLFVLVREGGSV